MCGRFVYDRARNKWMRISDHLAVEANHNVAPGTVLPVIISDESENEYVELMKWGLVPFWAKEEKIGYKMINARAETITEKSSFRDAFRIRRCVILADGFYEWEPITKQPHYYSPTNADYFNFAGIWSSWKRDDGTELKSFSIITTEANEVLAPVHNRMPAILGDNETGGWLTIGGSQEMLHSFIKPYSGNLMQEWPVSKEVNNARSVGSQLTHPINSA